MLTKRIIPCLDVKDNKVVKGIQFVGLREVGDPVQLASKYAKDGADELVFLDITATNEHRKTMVDMVAKVAQEIFIPFTVGGGITQIEDVTKMLRAGADKCSLNSAAVKRPELLAECANVFGNQCVVLAVDAKKRLDASGWNVMVHGGKLDTRIDVLEWIVDGVSKGAGEILLTSLDADGSKEGYDIELLKAVKQRVNVPVIASGGCGKIDDIVQVFQEDCADAALAASLFHYNEKTILDVKQELRRNGIPVRL